MKDRYLFVLPWRMDSIGGVNEVVINLFEQFQKDSSYEPLVLINNWHHASPLETVEDDRRTIYYRLRSPWDKSNPVTNFLKFLISLPGSIFTLRRIVKEKNIKAINVHFPGTWAISLIASAIFGAFSGRILLSFHGADVRFIQEAGRFERALWSLIFRHTHMNVVCSQDLREKLRSVAPRGTDIAVIHNGIDFRRFLQERDAGFVPRGELAGRRLIVNVANFEHKKGQDILIEAFSKIAVERKDVALLMIGRTTDYLADVRKLIGSANRENIFVVTDAPHARIINYLEMAEIFVLPSREEPFGIAILEAAGCRLPVVASSVGGIVEIITDQETGLLVPPEDVGALQAAMERLLASEDLRQALGARLHDHVSQQFEWRASYRKYLDLVS